MNLQPSLAGVSPAIDVSGVLQLLELQRASGTFELGAHALRLVDGMVVKASGDPIETVAAIVSAHGVFAFRKARGVPNGSLRLSVTGLLLEAARLADESAVVPT